ncbi:methyl-accepting chemotaxis protein [Cohnella hongkongensis]|uniref:Methyl-accepting chemotaxis protein n=1 Tax=Cohnella hongkongensis TaxID=178337 RepID=A0ABV9FB19_9BACL
MRTVRTKLLGAFAILMVFVFGLAFTGLTQIKKVSSFTDEVSDYWLVGIEKIMSINLNIERYLTNYYQTTTAETQQQAMELTEARNQLVSAIDADIQNYGQTLANEQDASYYETLVQEWEQFQKELAKMAIPNATEAELVAATADAFESLSRLKAAVDALVDFNQAGAERSQEESAEIYRSTSTLLFILGAVVLLVVAALAWVLIANLTKPLKATTAVMNRISAGDLKVDLLRVDRKDEFGDMMESVNKTLLALRQSVQQMQEASTSVATASAQLYASSGQNSEAARHVSESINEVAAGSEEQANTAVECGRVMDEMAVGVQRIAETTGEVSDLSQQAARQANNGSLKMVELTGRIQRLSETVEQAGLTIMKLEEQSTQISEISGLIGELAYRTNLLALNAGIEAARAGEHGKGFAVVAGEVRKLAAQSDESSKGIIERIEAIQKDTLAAAEAMKLSLQEVQEGVIAVELAEQSFKEIVASTGEVSTRVQEAAASAEQLAASSEEVAASVSNMGHIARQTAGMSQQVAATTEEQLASSEEMTRSSQMLSDIAKDLQKLVRKFTL